MEGEERRGEDVSGEERIVRSDMVMITFHLKP